MNLFAKANAGLALTPGQRTILRAVETCLIAALVSFLAALPALTSGQQINWGAVAGAFGVALLMALSKWFKAHGDTALGDAAVSAADQLAHFADVPNDVVIEPELPAMPADGAEAVSTAGQAAGAPLSSSNNA